jgi:hypothetical protein
MKFDKDAYMLFHIDSVDGTSPNTGAHTFKSTIIGGEGPFIPAPTHSILTYLGPNVWMILIDCRFVTCALHFE